MFTIKDYVEAEIIEKKSRFICQIKHSESEEEALNFIAEVKRKRSQARHNVYAYVVKQANCNTERIRFTDDGEPSQTAGKPTLQMLQHENLSQVSCVVTRYFGGTLLGTGGLVRAYSSAVKAAIEKAKAEREFIEMVAMQNFKKTLSYSEFGSLKHAIEKQGGIIDEVAYLENVDVSYRLPRVEP